MAERARERSEADEDTTTQHVAEAVNPKTDALYSVGELVLAGETFGVSNETLVGALHAAGHPRDAHLTAKQVEDAVRDFRKREVTD